MSARVQRDRGNAIFLWAVFVAFAIATAWVIITHDQEAAELRKIVWGPGPCSFTGIGWGGSLRVECDGKERSVFDQSVILSYALNPGPLTCTVNRGGNAFCNQRRVMKLE